MAAAPEPIQRSAPAPAQRLARGLSGFLAFAAYSALSMIFFGRTVLGRFHTVVLGRGSDPTTYLWSFQWWSYAVRHGYDPFFTHAVWAPTGLNLAWTTCMPTAARLAALLVPRTGPVVPYNVLCLACPALAGWAAFLLCHHFVRRFWPALLGGYVFGFSSYMLGQTLGHLPQQCVFAVPLAALLAILLIEERRGRWLWTALLALVLALQFGLALEVFATLTFFGTIAFALFYFFSSRKLRVRMLKAVAPIAAAYVAALAIQWNYLYHLFFFGQPAGPINSPTAFSAGLVNFLCPTPIVELGRLAPFARLASHFPGNLAEAGAYFGPFLILVVVLWIRTHFKESTAKALFWLLIVIAIAALGPRLHVAGWIGPGMPWKVFTHVPLIRDALPARFTLYGFLGVAVIVALYFADGPFTAVRVALVVLIVLAMVPNLSRGFWGRALAAPSFFTAGSYHSHLTPGETVVALPYGRNGDVMMWQAVADMYFKLAGGYTGATIPPEFASWPIVGALMHETALPDMRAQLLAFMAAHNADAVLLDARRRGSLAALIAPLKVTPIAAGGILIYRVNASELAAWRGSSPLQMERRCDAQRFAALLHAAVRYLAQGGVPARLTPMAAQQRDLLPPNWVRDAGVRTRNGLFLGSRSGGRIAVGINASYRALTPLVARYGKLASTIYFPYPHRLDARSRHKPGVRMMVMVFDHDALARAASLAPATPSAAVRREQPAPPFSPVAPQRAASH